MSISVRTATKNDLPRILELEEQFDADAFDLTQFKRLFTPNRLFYILLEDNDIIGYSIVNLRKNSKTAYLHSLCIDEKYHGKGYGRKFLEILELESLECSYTTMKLHVKVNNTSAIKLYTNMHYIKYDTVSKYYANGEDAYEMYKNLYSYWIPRLIENYRDY